MSNFTFNFGQADAVMEDVARVNRQIAAALDELERSVESSLQGWESEEVKTVYQATKARWDQAALQMNAFLDRAQQALGSVRENYGITETRNAAKWSQS